MIQNIDVEKYQRDAMYVTGSFVVIVLLLKIIVPFVQNSTSQNYTSKGLVEQSMQWYANSINSKHALYAFREAVYALAYLNAARHTADDSTLERMTKIDIHKLHSSIDAQQRQAMSELGSTCPKIKLRSRFTTGSGWL